MEEPLQPYIQIQDLCKSFWSEGERGVVQALDRVNLSVAEGEFLSIIGQSGCGKSTLLHIIAGLRPYFPADAGQVSVNGLPVRSPGADRCMVFQEYALLPWRTVQDNIEMGLKFSGVSRKDRALVARHYVDLVGLTGFERHFPHQLSGGMKQRAAVARALALRPRVLLMDEPFAAVDAQTRMTLQEEMSRLWEVERRTVIFVTHSVEEAVFLSNRIVVMSPRPGRVAEIVDVPLPRPRRWTEIQRQSSFSEVVAHVLALVRR